MISVDTLRKCSFLSSPQLEQILRKRFPNDCVTRSEFLGISNGEQFVYSIAFPDPDAKNGLETAKLYVWQGSNGELVADY
jgi:hypothetical protein